MPIPILPIVAVIGGVAAVSALAAASKAEDAGQAENEATTLNSEELIQRLEREGWEFRGKRDRHWHFAHPKRPGRVTIAHPSTKIPRFALRSIFRQAGWDWPEH